MALDLKIMDKAGGVPGITHIQSHYQQPRGSVTFVSLNTLACQANSASLLKKHAEHDNNYRPGDTALFDPLALDYIRI